MAASTWTGDRWDTRAHLDDDPGRRQPNGKAYKPWHDATTALSGPVAAALAQECRNRWLRATGDTLEPVHGDVSCWPDELQPDFEQVDVAIARTHPEMADQEAVHEIEHLFLTQIATADRFLYCESQYFASRRIAEAIARRLDEPNGPEIIIINPEAAEGWLQPLAMDTARARLIAALRQRDRHRRLAVYHPFTANGDPIYVHAKITIVDDQQLRIGSANMNNRSLRLDTECDVVVDAARQPGRDLAPAIAAIRDGLLAEHLGVSVERIATMIVETGSIIETIEKLRSTGHSLRPYEVPDLTTIEAWLADNEVLDPEGPSEMFEPLTKRGLFRRLSKTG